MASVVRDAAVSEIDTLRALYRRSSLSNEQDRETLLAHPDALEWSDAAVREQRTRVAVRDGRIVGFATTDTVEGALDLVDLFVEPDRMRQGVARDLIADVVEIARRRGVTRIEVTGNDHALDFYERVGFVRDGVVTTRFRPAVHLHLDVGPRAGPGGTANDG